MTSATPIKTNNQNLTQTHTSFISDSNNLYDKIKMDQVKIKELLGKG